MRRITSAGIVIAVVALVMVLGADTSTATTAKGVTPNFTYRAAIAPNHFDSNDFKMFQKNSEDVVVRELTFAPGGDGGWHSHPGPAYVVVIQGTLTNYQGDDPTCTGVKISAGEGFVEPALHVHIARNETSAPAVVVATLLNVPVGGAYRIDAAPPGNCPF